MGSLHIEKVNVLAEQKGVTTAVVRAIIGISKPVRASIRLFLVQKKQELQGQLSTVAFKTSLLKRQQAEIFNVYGQAQEKFSQVKRLLSMLQVGPDFYDNAAFKELINLLLVNVKIKGVTLGGYRDMDNSLNVINFNAQQIIKAVNITELTANALNDKIDAIDKYIDILDAVDNL